MYVSTVPGHKHTKVEGITGRWCKDHDQSCCPYKDIRPQRRSEWFCVGPEFWIRKDTLPINIGKSIKNAGERR